METIIFHETKQTTKAEASFNNDTTTTTTEIFFDDNTIKRKDVRTRE
jgi:hypothetical protein